MIPRSQTLLGKEEQKRLSQILQQLMESPDSLEFRQPVDYQGLGLEDYTNIIKFPMDLGTCQKKLISNKYRTVEESLDDIQLIWDNCKTYNAIGSWIWKLSDKLEKSFKKYVKNYLPLVQLPISKFNQANYLPDARGKLTNNSNINGVSSQQQDVFTEEPGENVTYSDKVEFANNLKQLQPEQVGLIVHLIQNSSSNAFTEIDKERYQIIVDNIDPDVFAKCCKQIDMWLTGEQQTKKQKI